jgi:hypothetical protein
VLPRAFLFSRTIPCDFEILSLSLAEGEELPKREKEFLLLKIVLKSCYTKIELNKVAFFDSRLGQFKAT